MRSLKIKFSFSSCDRIDPPNHVNCNDYPNYLTIQNYAMLLPFHKKVILLTSKVMDVL